MSKGWKIFLTVAGVVTLLWVGAIVTAAAVIAHDGMLHVSIHEKGPDGANLSIPIPMALVTTLLNVIPVENLDEASSELQHWGPVVRAAVEELERCPDGPLIQVESVTEHVNISKSGGSLVVEIRDSEDEVNVSMPISGVGDIVEILTRRAMSPPRPGQSPQGSVGATSLWCCFPRPR